MERQTKTFILSNRARKRTVAMGCVVEFEAVIEESHKALVVTEAREITPGSTVFHICLSPREMLARQRELAKLKSENCQVVIYVFDAWNLPEIVLGRRKGLSAWFTPPVRLARFCDLLCVPFSDSFEALKPLESEVCLAHIPLAVDTRLANGLSKTRPLDVFAYGRQPKQALGALEKMSKSGQEDRFVYRTDHTKVDFVRDIARHRAMFWSIAERSRFALAYNRKSAPIQSGPKFDFVAQRWFESLAAGCIVVGHRPETPEFAELFNWPYPTLEAPSDHDRLPDFLDELNEDRNSLDEMRLRNVNAARKHHDWRIRLNTIEKFLQ